jgi:hypothetical protein
MCNATPAHIIRSYRIQERREIHLSGFRRQLATHVHAALSSESTESSDDFFFLSFLLLLLLLFSTTSVADRLEKVNTVASIQRRSRDEQPRALVLPVKNSLDLLLSFFFVVGAGAGLCRLA